MSLIRKRRLSEIIVPLHEIVEHPGGLFRVYYVLRDVPRGRTNGLMGVVDRDLVLRYARALERTARTFREWGWDEPRRWPEHGNRVPVYVFQTLEWVNGNVPFTFTDSWGYSQIGLRSLIPEPRLDVVWERADVDAVHEATHVFTHRQRQIQPRIVAGVRKEDAWSWLDEATAGFMEGWIFQGHKESMRHAINFVYRPDLSLIYDGTGGGYFAAWFIRHIVDRHGPNLIKNVWKQGGSIDGDPIMVIDQELKQNHACTFEAAFTDYCVASANTWEFDFEVFTRHGNRLVTEAIHLSQPGVTIGTSEVDWLGPLACRYYRIDWGFGGIAKLDVAILPAAGSEADAALRAVLLVIGPSGIATRQHELTPALASSGAPLRCKADVSGDAAFAILVVFRGVAPEDSCGRYSVEVSG